MTRAEDRTVREIAAILDRNTQYWVGIGTFLILARLESVERKLDRILVLENQEMADLTQITADVAANTDTVASAVALLTQLHDEIVAAGTDPAALAALASSLEANTQALADAVVANTPVA